tara:strand:- start:230 stop:451 length:222 start_codon:yes stop_codon:yes gene_type:complete
MIKSVTKIWSYNKDTEQNDILGSYKVVLNEWDKKTQKWLKDDKISFVPLDEENTRYQEIQEWVAAGNTIAEGK